MQIDCETLQQLFNSLYVFLTGIAGVGVMFLARYVSAYINGMSGFKKMGLMLIIPQGLQAITKVTGVVIPDVASMTDPSVVHGLAGSVVAMGLWAAIKEVMKAMDKYKLSPVQNVAK